jgi:hypothetical protein
VEPIFYVREYQEKADKPFSCYKDKEPLVTNINSKDEVYLYCLYCGYKYNPEPTIIKNIIKVVESWNNE